MIVDSHLHLWTLGEGAYSWLTPELGDLYRSFTAAEARSALDAAGVDQAILVQADDTLADTEFLLDVARDNDWIVGVVGWVPLERPVETAVVLDRWQSHPSFCGVRHLVHDDPRDEFLALPAVRESLSDLARRAIAFDVPNAFPRHLRATAELAEALPELTIVVDHLAKPPSDADAEARAIWLRELGAVSRSDNTVAKFSGLRVPGERYDVATLRPLWESALELFGPNRLMFGGDWPVSGEYGSATGPLRALIAELSDDEQAAVLGGTALNVY